MPVPHTSPANRARRPSATPAARADAPDPWTLISVGSLRILQLAPFNEFPWLVHGFSTLPGGVSPFRENLQEKVLNLGFSHWDTRENALENRRLFQSALGAADFPLVTLRQCHSDLIHHFPSVPPGPQHGDASLTRTPRLLLAVQTADCVPILLVDPKRRAISAIHAGWRGTLARIAEKAVGRMRMQFNSNPEHLLAALGPAIGPCCYEVGPELVTRFTSQFAEAADWFDEPRTGEEPNPLQWMNMAPPGHQPPPKNVHLDLRKALRAQLLAAGLRDANIFSSDLCTACRPDLFFSYRKQGPHSGRLLSAIALRPS
jgi:YfiH family protein